MTYAIRKGKNFRSSPKVIHTRLYKKFDENLFSHDLTQEDWSDFTKQGMSTLQPIVSLILF